MKIKVTIETKSPLLVSEEVSSIWNKSQKRDINSAYIPGSALKGALRETADTLTPYKQEVFSLFGMEGSKQGKLQFSKIICKDPSYIEKTHVVLNRKTKTHAHNKLFSTNALANGNILEGYIYVDGELTAKEKELLDGLTKMVKKIGGMKSAGYGLVDISFEYQDSNSKVEVSTDFENYALLVLEPLEPFLAIKERSKNYMYKSSKIIYGETIRGAYAQIISNDPLFEKIILNEEVKFPTVVPSKEDKLMAPSPSTTMKRKYKSTDTGIFDLALAKMVENNINIGRNLLSLEDMSTDGERLENVGGYLDYFNNSIINVESDTKQYTQTAVSRQTRATKAGQLRSYITEHFEKMVGIIRSSNKEYIEMIARIESISVGNSKTRGFGKMKAKIIPLHNLKEQFEKNIKSFTESVKRHIKSERTYIPLLLTSDLIVPVGKELKDLFSGFEVNQTIYRKDTFSSWNTGTNNTKTFYETLKAGSVIILESENENCIEEIWQMFLDGLGHRTGSGFGSFLVVDYSKLNTVGGVK